MVRRNGVPVFFKERREFEAAPRSLTQASLMLGAAGSLFLLAGFYYVVAMEDASSKVVGMLMVAYGGGHMVVAKTGWASRWNLIAGVVFSILGVVLGVVNLTTPSSAVAGLVFVGLYGYVGWTLLRWRLYRG
jgi:hypothetical protein